MTIVYDCVSWLFRPNLLLVIIVVIGIGIDIVSYKVAGIFNVPLVIVIVFVVVTCI